MRALLLLAVASGIFMMFSCGTPPPPLPGWYLEQLAAKQDGGGSSSILDASANIEGIKASEDPSGDESDSDSEPDKQIIVPPPPPRKPCPDVDKDGYGPASAVNLPRCQGVYKSNQFDCNDNNASIYPGASQQCNGEDNDCDGTIDSGMTKPCRTACGSGIITCETSGKWGECSARKPAASEICDSAKIDENCNGQINEGCECVDTEVASCGQGPCPLGQKQCQDGKWGPCIGNRTATKEICDGQDNDCSGKVDDLPDQQCTTICGTGTETCQGGKWINCTAQKPEPEICDGKDNDCNGKIDDDPTCKCIHGEQRLCGTNIGECKVGAQNCIKGQWGPCTGTGPTSEICDAKDNDCNGKIDDSSQCTCIHGTSISCGTNIGECTTGSQLCTNGVLGKCSGILPTSEICDGKDNNCNGQLDETCACVHGKNYPCGKDTGECTTGTQLCTKGVLGVCTGIGPTSEICNNKDDDCNGAIDDKVTQPCTTACGSGTQTCSAGKWSVCSNSPKPETCNNKDDNCNGTTDEGLTQPCKTACGPGVEVCLNGLFVNCDAPPVKVETCNNVDDNCDGNIDENLKQTCKTACGTGVETCSNGKWIGCDAPPVQAETCNNVDDNCNGTTDEGLTQPCKTACGPGTETCRAGQWVQCNAQQPSAEVCDAAFKDENCDGKSNEGCNCVNGKTQACGSDVGACKKGIQLCTNGQWGACTGEIKPTTETCNNIDDDCNGSIDNGITPKSCSTICGTGTETCEFGKWVKCTAQNPTPEICNNKDDNCDGSIDNGIAARPCGSGVGICTKGTETCSAGQWVNCTAPKAQTEICDGLDNNCDGQIDENLTAPSCTNQLGVCAGKVKVCGGTSGWLACTPTQYGADYEVTETRCDGKDNDCDGSIDENITRPCGSGIGICTKGTETCTNGSFVGCTAPTPRTEICNNKDDNCNGQIDDGISSRYCTNACRTRQSCSNGTWTPSCQQPQNEICNGRDDNCDGSTDEGTSQTCSFRCTLGPNTVQGYRDCNNGSLTACYDKNGYCPKVGDGRCETSKGENCQNSTLDCRCSSGYECQYQGSYKCVPKAICGDGTCNGSDTQSNCCQDCGCPSGQQCTGSGSKTCKPRYTTTVVGTGCRTNHSGVNEGTLCLRIDYSGSGKTFYAYIKKQQPGYPWQGNQMDALITMYGRNQTCNVSPQIFSMSSTSVQKGAYGWSGRITFDIKEYSCPGIGSSKTIYIKLRSPYDCSNSVCYFNTGDVTITRNW